MWGREGDADTGGADSAADGAGATDHSAGYARPPREYGDTRNPPGNTDGERFVIHECDADGNGGGSNRRHGNAGITADGRRRDIHEPRKDLSD